MQKFEPLPENLNEAVGLVFVDLRQKETRTQREAAQLIGLSQSQLSKFESGEAAISINQLATISSAYGVSPVKVLQSAIAKLGARGGNHDVRVLSKAKP